MTGRGAVGKAAVAGDKDRESNRVTAGRVTGTDTATLQGFVRETAKLGASACTDDAAAYSSIRGFHHEAVNHSAGGNDRRQARTNGIESFWAMLKRDYRVSLHHFSVKHLDRYVIDFAERRNVRDADAADMMAYMARSVTGKRLRFADLNDVNELDSGARA